jgi:AraC family ethanolamine operon transcriptional activator
MHVMRLNKVRRALRAADAATTVTEAAMRFGFFHLGRFSAQYHRLFGERPSDTLQRARRRSAQKARLATSCVSPTAAP